jgi:hypothetical protein
VKKREYLANLGVDERAILKWNFRNMIGDFEMYLVRA